MTAWVNHWPTLSAPVENPTLRVLSLGAGVQSTTLALAAARGDIGPMPDCAIFADTGWEPKAVMRHLEWLRGVLPFPVHIVSAGDLREDTIRADSKMCGPGHSPVPWWTVGADGRATLGRRQCTRHYKIDPVVARIRLLLGMAKGQRVPRAVKVEQWIGISTDEIERMKPARQRYLINRWPLIEAGMDRRKCIDWLADRQFKAPRSACRGCPFLSNAEWRDQRDNDPAGWEDTVSISRLLAERGEFMHRSCLPIDHAPINDADDPQGVFGFKNECEGMCGS